MRPNIQDQFKFAAGLSYCLATSFTYYVTLVQFGLMHHFEKTLGLSFSQILPGLLALAFCGIAGAIVSGIIIDKMNPRVQGMLGAIGSCSIIAFGLAVLAFQVVKPLAIVAIMGALGLNLGALIVLLLLTFNRFLHLRVRGLFAGLVTAITYLAANIMAAYTKESSTFGTINAIAIGTNVVVIIFIWEYAKSARFQPIERPEKEDRFFYRALAPLMLLIFLDTFCFYPIGRQGVMPNAILTGFWDWMKNGAWHFLIALMAGVFAFSVGNRRLMQVGFLSMIVVCGLLIGNSYSPMASGIYPAWGLIVGVYTIVFFTVWGRLLPKKNQGLWLGIGIALCGWVGSGAGIGASMAVLKSGLLDFPYYFIPPVILAIAGIILLRPKNIFFDYAEQVKQEEMEETSVKSE